MPGLSGAARPDQAASPPQACGQIKPKSLSAAAMAAGNAPGTQIKAPSNPNSPMA